MTHRTYGTIIYTMKQPHTPKKNKNHGPHLVEWLHTRRRKENYLVCRLQQGDADIIADAMDLPGVLGNRSAAVRLILRQWNEQLNPKRKRGEL